MLLKSPNEKRDKILQLDSRRKIYEIVKNSPCCHFREIERISKISHGTLKYNLNFLVKNELLIIKKDGNNVRYFCGEFNKANIEMLTLLRHKQLRKIILFILLNKNSNNEEISRSIKLSHSTVSWHIQKLILSKIILQKKDRHKTKYSLLIDENELMKMLITYKESFFDTLVNKAIEMWELP